MERIDRRQLLRLGVGAAAAGAIARLAESQEKPASGPAKELPSAALGGTKRRLPRLGLGCFPLSTLAAEEPAVAVVRRALELGVRYFDTAPSYGNGSSERRVGAAIHGFDRASLYLATKTLARDADGARRELEESLKRLGVSFVDAIQVHEVHEDWESLFRKGGVVEGLEKAREEGLARFLGLTGHRDPAFVAKAIERHPFATALVPVNPIDPQHRSFVRDFLPAAAKRGVAVVAMKIFAGGKLLSEKRATAAELVGYALAQPQVSVIVPGCASVAELEEAHAAALAPLPGAEALAALEKKVGEHRGKDSEWYKND